MTDKRLGSSNSSLHTSLRPEGNNRGDMASQHPGSGREMFAWPEGRSPFYHRQRTCLLRTARGPAASGEPGDHRQPVSGIHVLPCLSTCPSVKHPQDLESATKLGAFTAYCVFAMGAHEPFIYLDILPHSSLLPKFIQQLLHAH